MINPGSFRWSTILKHDERGFTLLELLIALSLLAVLAAALYGTFFSLTKGREAATVAMEKRREIASTIDLLRRELRGALYHKGDTRFRFVVEDRDSFSRPASNLDFTAFTVPQEDRGPFSDQAEIRYTSLEKDGKLLLARQEKDLYALSDAVPYPQVTEMEGFLVECFNGDKWVKSWDTTLNGTLPKAVRITLTVKNGEEKIAYTAVVTPMVAVQ